MRSTMNLENSPGERVFDAALRFVFWVAAGIPFLSLVVWALFFRGSALLPVTLRILIVLVAFGRWCVLVWRLGMTWRDPDARVLRWSSTVLLVVTGTILSVCACGTTTYLMESGGSSE